MSAQVISQITMSLDGFVAGQNDSPANPMGDNGESIHEWIFRLQAWRERHGLEGGVDDDDSRLLDKLSEPAGAVVMGRRMFDHGFEPWGDTPPFHAPVFVVTHRPHAPIEKLGGTTFYFVTDGPLSALEQAKQAAAATGRGVSVAGGANVLRQLLRAEKIDSLMVHVVPVLLGGGVRLFDDGGAYPNLKQTEVTASPHAAHLSFERTQA